MVVAALKLDASHVEGSGRFKLTLSDAGTELSSNDAVVNERQLRVLRNLPRQWRDYGLQDETERLRAIGDWARKSLLGCGLVDTLVRHAPVQVWIQPVPQEIEWLREVPIGIATTSNGWPLVRRNVVFATDVGRFEGPPKSSVQNELRVLAAFSSPTGKKPLNLRRERYRMTKVAQDLIRLGDVAVHLKVLQYGATGRALHDALADAKGWDIVHLSGHGGIGVLEFEDTVGGSETVAQEQLIEWLALSKHQLKLVTLAACDSAAAHVHPTLVSMGDVDVVGLHPQPDGQNNAGLAQAIAKELGCTVVAMRYPVVDSFAAAFTESLFTGMLKHENSAVSAVGLAIQEAAADPPTLGVPYRSALTPAAVGTLDEDLSTLPPPRRQGPRVKFYPSMVGFPEEPRHFVGRVDVLALVSAGVSKDNDHMNNTILHGMAQIGKTLCALEIAYGRRDEFDTVRWFQFTQSAGARVRPKDFGEFVEIFVKAIAVETTDWRENFDQWTDEVNAAMRQHGIFVVFDGVEALLEEDGEWRDERWGRFFEALCDHVEGNGRVLMTSQVCPKRLSPETTVTPVPPLSRNEAILLVRELPHLSRLLLAEPQSTELNTIRQVLSASRGHPRLLFLADRGLRSGGATLHRMIEEADAQWRAAGVGPDVFMATNVQPEAWEHAEVYKDILERWLAATADKDPPDGPDGPVPPSPFNAGPHDRVRRGDALREEGRPHEAERQYRVAAEYGSRDAAFRLARLFEDNGRPDEAIAAYEQAATTAFGEEGLPEASFCLAERLWADGRADDAEPWYRKAALAGHHQAAYQLGWLMKNERENADDALTWWRRAAIPQHLDAAFEMGETLWSKGELDKAAVWYEQAAEGGHSYSAYQLGKLLERMGDADGSRTWIRRAADQGEPNALGDLGQV